MKCPPHELEYRNATPHPTPVPYIQEKKCMYQAWERRGRTKLHWQERKDGREGKGKPGLAYVLKRPPTRVTPTHPPCSMLSGHRNHMPVQREVPALKRALIFPLLSIVCTTATLMCHQT